MDGLAAGEQSATMPKPFDLATYEEIAHEILAQRGLQKGERLALTYLEAADAVGYSLKVIRAAIDRGDLVPSYATRTKPVIRVAELQRWLRTLPSDGLDY